jgi:hypothetical protein
MQERLGEVKKNFPFLVVSANIPLVGRYALCQVGFVVSTQGNANPWKAKNSQDTEPPTSAEERTKLRVQVGSPSRMVCTLSGFRYPEM